MTSEKEMISCAEVPHSSLTHMNLANRFAHSVEFGFLFYMARKVEACLRMSIPYILYSSEDAEDIQKYATGMCHQKTKSVFREMQPPLRAITACFISSRVHNVLFTVVLLHL